MKLPLPHQKWEPFQSIQVADISWRRSCLTAMSSLSNICQQEYSHIRAWGRRSSTVSGSSLLIWKQLSCHTVAEWRQPGKKNSRLLRFLANWIIKLFPVEDRRLKLKIRLKIWGETLIACFQGAVELLRHVIAARWISTSRMFTIPLSRSAFSAWRVRQQARRSKLLPYQMPNPRCSSTARAWKSKTSRRESVTSAQPSLLRLEQRKTQWGKARAQMR